ncbi:MAG TPA: carboxypeptidase regulatory-like domain-containing protein [Candidatus Nanoarchaeia archaeon]|nr:carboxypeptidase regulatory-like domain-containing protein [Candidatus Nanoarchaeia archaeon]
MNKKEEALLIAKKEWYKEKIERKRHYMLLSLFLAAIFLLISVFLVNFIKTNGFATISSKAGEITEVSIVAGIPVNVWGGFYGLVLRVPGFTETLYTDLDNGGIERADVFFDCLKFDAPGGPEVYASINPSLNLVSAEVTPATIDMINQYINCTDGGLYCAENTFTRNTSVFLGSQEIANVPSTYTYRYDGVNSIYDVGALNVSNELVFFAHVNATMQKGFNPNNLVNYQLLLPTPVNVSSNASQRYYFYPDPFDECSAGGIGNTMNVSISGYVTDQSNSPISNATVTFVGYSDQTDTNGFYNITSMVLDGSYHVISQKTGFNTYVGDINVSTSTDYIDKNITMVLTAVEKNTLSVNVSGIVTDTGSTPLSNVTIFFGNSSTVSDSSGNYSISAEVYLGPNPLFAIKTDYDNYYLVLTITASNATIENQTIVMEPANLNSYPTGPYTQGPYSSQRLSNIIEQKKDEGGQDFWISPKEINKQVRLNTFVQDQIDLYNFKPSSITLTFTLSPELEDIISLDKTAITLGTKSASSIGLTISGTKPVGVYRGTIKVSGSVEQEIPVRIEIVPQNIPIQNMRMELSLLSSSVSPGDSIRYKLDLKNLLTDYSYRVKLKYLITDPNGTRVYYTDNETIELKDSLNLLKKADIPKNLSDGEYQIVVEANYMNLFSTAAATFTVATKLYLYSFFGVPLWAIFLGGSMISFMLFGFFLYEVRVNKNKRYHLDLDTNALPKPGDRSVKIGFLAEKKIPAYYNIDDLTTHAIVAGATGGGKSISAQVFVEEALMKNIAVIVFDPTAQWSGMLRKCDDKRMMSFYPKFGLKESSARAFPGNIRLVENERQSIDIGKYITPGNIQVFSLNKLTPQQIDVFVAGVISNIFKSDPKESPNLKVLLVFDEVHRLLPKFGGSGKGFLQIERACREFRKWGLGVMLVSQVLSDFVGEIKANINTEVLMRAAEENDLLRIKERYGEDALKSLVRADVGTGMIQNAEYNKGKPYFVSLRPILHNTRRLSDEVLLKYNHYNEIIDDIEYQIEQLEAYKVDASDLKIEVKLIKDKLIIGNFTVVDIYLEGILPKLEKYWDKINKRPKKKEITLIDVRELESSIKEAEKNRTQWQKATAGTSTAPAEVKAPKISDKIVAPFTFNNGLMISSLKELSETMPGIDKAVISEHVNKNKNELAAWVASNVDSTLGTKMKKSISKEDIMKDISDFIEAEKEKDKPKTSDSKESESKTSEKATAQTQEPTATQNTEIAEEKAPEKSKTVKKEVKHSKSSSPKKNVKKHK